MLPADFRQWAAMTDFIQREWLTALIIDIYTPMSFACNEA